MFRRTDENGVWMEHNPLLEPVQEVFVHFGLLLKWRNFKGQAPALCPVGMQEMKMVQESSTALDEYNSPDAAALV